LCFWISEINNLSNRNSVLTVKDLIGPDKLSTVFLQLFASFCQCEALLSRRCDRYLNRLVVLHIDVVLEGILLVRFMSYVIGLSLVSVTVDCLLLGLNG
jgi:hypothetical protein